MFISTKKVNVCASEHFVFSPKIGSWEVTLKPQKLIPIKQYLFFKDKSIRVAHIINL